MTTATDAALRNRRAGAFARAAARFAGWWAIFAGAVTVGSVCPFCGSQACPAGVGAAGLIAFILAAAKQWGGGILHRIRRVISFHRPSHRHKIQGPLVASEAGRACHCRVIEGSHRHGTEPE